MPLASSPLQATTAIIYDEIKNHPELRKCLSGYNQRVFSTHLALVAHCIRTGYLVDLFVPKNAVATFSSLIAALRTNPHKKDLFEHVVHVFEPSSEQSFFVSDILLAERIQLLLPNDSVNVNALGPEPVFLHLMPPIKILDNAPNDVLKLLDSLLPLTSTRDSGPLSFSIPTKVTTESAVPLAAVLLDYPIAYIPSTSNPNALSGIPLDFYECVLISATENHKASITDEEIIRNDKHIVMKFSCPAHLTGVYSGRCQPTSIISGLEEMFTKRLQIMGISQMRCEFVHSTQTLDHVTF